MVVTEDTSHDVISTLNNVASLNIFDMSPTFATFQPLTEVANIEAPWNIADILVTLLTFHRLMS
jgi:hypothetical protein